MAISECEWVEERERVQERGRRERECNEEVASLAGKINSGEPANLTFPTFSPSLSLSLPLSLALLSRIPL